MNHSCAVTACIAVLLMGVLCGCAVAPVQVAESNTPRAIPQGVEATPVQFSRIVTKLPLGEQIGQYQYGWGCLPGAVIGWRGGRLNVTDEELVETFRKELQTRNWPVVGDPYALFGDPASSGAEILGRQSRHPGLLSLLREPEHRHRQHRHTKGRGLHAGELATVQSRRKQGGLRDYDARFLQDRRDGGRWLAGVLAERVRRQCQEFVG